MANSQQHTIEIVFAGVDEFSDTLNKIGSGLQDFSGGLQNLIDPIANAAKEVLKLESALGVSVVAGLSAADAKATEFKKSLNEINVVGGFTPEIFDELGTKALDAFSDIKSTDLSGYMEALNQTVAFGVQGIPEIFNAITVGEQLSIAGTAELDKTIVGLLGTMNAYGATQNEINRYADIFFQITQDGNASVEELSTQLSGVTATAFSAGINFETIGASIAALTAQGVPTSQAITAINAAIGAILNPTSDAAKRFDELGIQYGVSGIKAKGFEGVLKDIFTATKGNADEMIKLITTQEGFKAAVLLGSDASGIFADSLKNMENVTGAVSEGVKRNADGIQVSFAQVRNSFDEFLIRLGQQVKGFNSNLFEPLRNLFLSLGESVETESFDKLFDFINKFGENFKNELNNIAKNLPDAFKDVNFDVLIKSFERLKDSVLGLLDNLFDGADLSTVDGLQKALQAIVNTFASLTENSAGIVSQFGIVIKVISDAIGWFNDLDESTKELIGQIGGIAIVLTPVLTVLTAVGASISTVGTVISGTTAIIATMTPAISGLATAAGILALPLAAVVSGVTGLLYFTDEKAKKGIDDLSQSFIGWADSLLDWSGTAGESGKTIDSTTEKLIAEAKAMQDARKATDETTASLKGLSETPAILDIEINKQSLPQQLADIQKEISSLEQTKIELEASLTDATGPEREKILSSIFDIEQAISQASGKEIFLTSEIDTKNTEAFLKDPDSFLSIEKTPIVLDANVKKEEAKKQVEELIVEVNGRTFVLEATIDNDAAKKTKEELEKIVPPEKQLKILADLDIAKFQEQTKQFESVQETIQKQLQFKAELNIAEVEANVAILEGSMENINTIFSESGSIISDAFGLLGSLDFGSAGQLDIFRLVKDQIKEQNDLQREALELQKEITLSQIKLNEAKQKALLAGEPLVNISIDGSNMEYELRAMALAFIRFAQIEATNEGLESLLGV